MLTLFGDIESSAEYAKRVVFAGINRPTYKVRVNWINFIEKGISLSYIDANGVNVCAENLAVPGIYLIFKENKSLESPHPTWENYYVGMTNNDVTDRVRRFMKGLTGILRDDETHAGGTRAKEDRVSMHDISVKFLPKSDFPDRQESIFSTIDERYIDEYVATILNCKYNTVKRT